MFVNFLSLDLCVLCGAYDGIQTYIDIEDYKGVKSWYHVCKCCSKIPDNELRMLICNKYNIKDRRLKDGV